MGQEFRFGIRMLARKPGFAAAALISLALGIGPLTAIFTLLDAVFVRPLSVDNPHELASLYSSEESESGEYVGYYAFSFPNFRDLAEKQRAFSDLLAFQRFWMNLSGGTEAARVWGLVVTGNYFDLLGLRPSHGRFFLPEEDATPGAHPVAVLSHGCWRRLFGADASIIGRTMRVNGHSFTVIGVGPKGFKGTQTSVNVDLWLPMSMFRQVSPYGEYFEQREVAMFEVVGRLRPGMGIEQADTELMGITRQLAEEYPKDNRGLGAHAVPLLKASLSPDERSRYVGYGRALAIAAGLILLIACLNVANLMLVRGLDRQRELAMRQALGAGRMRLIRQLLSESLMVFLLGALVSLPVARWSLDFLWSFRPPEFARDAIDLRLDSLVLGWALLTALITGLGFGLLPALRASKPDLVTALKESAGYEPGSSRRWQPRSVLVMAQVALALVALIGAGLLLRSLRHAQQIDLGFQPDRLLTMTFEPGAQGYDEDTVRQFYRRVVERAESLPGVRSATLSENRLLRGAVWQRAVFLEGQETESEGGGRRYHRNNVVVPGFFKTVGIPIVQGRDFEERDRADTRPVAIINETMARLAWPGEDPIGKRFHLGDPSEPLVEVIGVARDAKYREVHEAPQFFIYQPLSQRYTPAMTLHVRTEGDPAALIGTLRREVQALDPNLPLADVDTMSAFVAKALWMERMSAYLLSAFGLLALALAVVGVYGVVAYAVAQRRREIGIRMAVGARRVDIVRGVLGDAARVVAVGLVFGLLLASFALKPMLAHQLYGVGAVDPLTYASQAILLAAAALLASLIPSLRAARVDPVKTLRVE